VEHTRVWAELLAGAGLHESAPSTESYIRKKDNFHFGFDSTAVQKGNFIRP
jgi:hypothetical protein